MAKLTTEQYTWIAFRSLILIITSVAIGYAVFFKGECGIDKEFLSCDITGTAGDWFGGILFALASLFVSGVVKGLTGLSSPPKTNTWGFLTFIAWVAGALIAVFL